MKKSAKTVVRTESYKEKLAEFTSSLPEVLWGLFSILLEAQGVDLSTSGRRKAFMDSKAKANERMKSEAFAIIEADTGLNPKSIKNRIRQGFNEMSGSGSKKASKVKGVTLQARVVFLRKATGMSMKRMNGQAGMLAKALKVEKKSLLTAIEKVG
jgi:hypothetical protein